MLVWSEAWIAEGEKGDESLLQAYAQPSLCAEAAKIPRLVCNPAATTNRLSAIELLNLFLTVMIST